MSRGYRNNNPCNIRCSREKWDGEIQKSLIDPNGPINTKNKDIMVSMVTAMALHENGTVPKASDVSEGWKLFNSQFSILNSQLAAKPTQ